MLFVRGYAICAAIVLLSIPCQTHATNLLISGNSMGEYNTNLTNAVNGLGSKRKVTVPERVSRPNELLPYARYGTIGKARKHHMGLGDILE